MALSRMPSRLAAPARRIDHKVKPVDPFYQSREWATFASAIKRQRRFTCERCGTDHAATPWFIRADHIVARKDGGADYDPLNIACLCASCDNAKRAEEHRRRGQG